MKRNTLMMLGSVVLLSMIPVSASGGTVSDGAQPKAAGQTETADLIIKTVKGALEQETPDLSSQIMKDFLIVSDLYDELPEEIRQDILTVRGRIGRTICSQEGIIPAYEGSQEAYTEQNWSVQMEVTEGGDRDRVLEGIKEMYEGSAPQLVYYKNIGYRDIRTGGSHMHWNMFSLSFPVPQGYDTLTDPQVLTYSNGKLMDLSPERKGSHFYIENAMFLENIIVADVPVALTGLSMEPEASVNQGQKLRLRAMPWPAGTTERYSLEWKTSDPAVAKVSEDGTVTGLGAGRCTITASAAGREDIQASCQLTVVQGVHALPVRVEQVLEETRAYMLSVNKDPTIGSEWFVIGLARGGMDAEDGYFKTYYNHFANYLAERKGILTASLKYTEYSKAVIAMTAMGKDARDIDGYNLFTSLADLEQVKAQGANGPIWALIALNSNPAYTIPQVPGAEEQTTEGGLIECILLSRTPKGGWSMDGRSPDPDLTGMALQALSFYYQRPGYDEVTEAVDEGLELLSTMQRPSGGYSSMGVETLESCVQVVTALCMLGIDPEKDERFVKGGYWTIENMLTFHLEGSGFMHVKEGSNGGGAAGEVNGMATEQAYYALTAYQRLKEGRTGLYDMSDIRIERGGAGDGQGTGLETPAPTGTPSPSPAPAETPGSAPIAETPVPAVNEPVNEAATGASPPCRPLATAVPQSGRSYAGAASGKTAEGVSADEIPGKERSGEEVSEDTDGWDIELEKYKEEEDDWDLGREAVPAAGETPAVHSLLMGLLGGLVGAGGLEGGRLLLKRRR
ncbi:MAG: hypothetical protein HFH56_06330 [Lachnospiraceae bacterium]|jgi:hypothetical protein|nr:hypothetical protein [Lachnospiraceae bacterium]